MFERFTEAAQAVVIEAGAHATRLGHNWIGCEHFLLVLASSDDPVGQAFRDAGVTAARIESTIMRQVGRGRRLFDTLDREALATVGIDVDAVREAVEQTFGVGALDRVRRPTGRAGLAGRRGAPWRRLGPGRRVLGPGLTPRAKECIARAVGDARAGYVGAEQIALSVLGMKNGTVPHIFAAMGVSADALSADIADRYRKAG